MAQSIKYLWEEYFLLDKKLTLEFPSKVELNRFKSIVNVYKSRYLTRLESLGMSDEDTKNAVVHYEIVSEEPFIATLWLKEKAPRTRVEFKVIGEE